MKARHGRLIKFLIAVAAIAAIAFLAAWVESIRRDAAYPGRRAVESVGTGAVALAARVSPEVVEEFRKLAERFGDFDYYQMQRAVSGLSEINVEDSSEFLQLFTEIDRGLELSNADGDFKCAPQPSGDDLFDLAANAIDQYLAAQQPKKLYDVRAGVVQRRTLDEWQEQFTGDPRYWELRSFCEWRYEGRDVERAIGYLKEAMHQGIATADTAMLLFLAEWLRIRTSAGKGEEAKNQALEASLNSLLGILEQARELDPEQAWPDYFEAMLRFETGDLEHGLKCLDDGNAKPNYEYPRYSIVRFVEEHLSQYRPAGSAAVDGSILGGLVSLPGIDYKALKGYEQECLALSASASRPDIIETWHVFACRMALSWPDEALHTVVGINLDSKLVKFLEKESPPDFTAQQEDALRQAHGAIKAAINCWRNYDGKVSTTAWDLMQLAGGSRGFYIGYYIDIENQVRATREIAVPIIQDLQAVQYPEFEPAETLQAYAPVPDNDDE